MNNPYSSFTDSCITISNSHIEISNYAIPRIDNISNTPWLSTGLIALLLCTLYLVGKHKQSYIFAARNLISSKNRSVSYDDDNLSFFSSLLLWLINIISLSIFIIISVKSETFAATILRDYKAIFTILTVTAVFSILKFIGFKATAYIFNNKKNMRLYQDNYFTIVAILGITIIPISIGIIYSPDILKHIMVIVGYILLAFAFIMTTFKSIQIFFNRYSSLFYIFLYLCALEILPILLLIKVVSQL